MKIAFTDFINWEYKVESVYQMPLGGAQSSVCYLAEILVKKGHEVFLFNNTSEPGMSNGVMCFNVKEIPTQVLEALDILIVLNVAGLGIQIKPLLGKNTRLIFWTGHAHDQPSLQSLQDSTNRDVYDAMVFVSDWQRHQICKNFQINLDRTEVLRNCIGPSFSNIFSDRTSILERKSKPPILAYTSTPFRGLDILLEVFPQIRKAVPDIKLKVFSSMKVYQISDIDDESEYGSLYRQCQEMAGVEYIGSIPQSQLASELQSVLVLAYPNKFPETSCIAVMEAMASGCYIVTSDLAALPDTTAGFARLIPISEGREEYKKRFIQETVQVLQEYMNTNNTNIENHLREQVNYVNNLYTWSYRVEEWLKLFNSFSPSST